MEQMLPGATVPRVLRVLVVEDNGLIAAKVAHVLQSAGYEIVGPAATLGTALNLVKKTNPLDAAVLDVDLRGVPAYPLAELLRERGIPFLFLTGYEPAALAEPWRLTPGIEKPFEAAGLLRALQSLLTGDPPSRQVLPGAAVPATPLHERAMSAVKSSRELITEARIMREVWDNQFDPDEYKGS